MNILGGSSLFASDIDLGVFFFLFILLFLVTLVAVAAYLITGKVLRYARERDILDHPNERSSHTTPTPRGGGIAIVLPVVCATGVATYFYLVPLRLCIALCVGGILVAWIGWIDDKHHVAPRWRMAVHVIAALIAMIELRGFPVLHVGPFTWHLGIVGALIGIIGIVGGINFYNFMDGIDGIASVEGILVGIGGIVITSITSETLIKGGGLVVPSLLISAACLGFLPWNWSPAKIFMGDVGSGFLGYWFAVLAIASENLGAAPAFAWVLLLGVFVFDATATLMMRAMRGERLSEAHQSHAYQRAVQLGFSHRQVTSAVGLLTIGCIGLVWWAGYEGTKLTIAATIVVIIMAILYYILKRRRSAERAQAA